MYTYTGQISTIHNANDLVHKIASIGNVVIYVLVAMAIVFIVYATVMYFVKGETGDEGRRKAGMQILWGIVGLAIIVSLWGLVGIVLRTFPTDTTAPYVPNADFINPQ